MTDDADADPTQMNALREILVRADKCIMNDLQKRSPYASDAGLLAALLTAALWDIEPIQLALLTGISADAADTISGMMVASALFPEFADHDTS